MQKKIVKQIKTLFKKENQLKKYKKIFSNKQMQFFLSKLDFIFNKDQSDINYLFEIEKRLMNNFWLEQEWINIILNLSNKWLDEFSSIDWKSFAKYIFYIYNYSEFYNKKSQLNNLYSIDNFVEINDVKKNHYDKWIESLYNLKNNDFNKYVISVLRLVK